ncbi:MAG: GH3 auxin-responsive promoter family protein [Schleiferiaceae bacterium]
MSSIKEISARIWASLVNHQTKKWSKKPVKSQEKIFWSLIKAGKGTAFGKDHFLASVKSIEDFQNHVPIRDYEGLRPYVDRVVQGEKNVLWPGAPKYFAKTSGTTSGSKYIPITQEMAIHQIKSARNALLTHIYNTKNTKFLKGKMIFLQGSPVLEKTKSGIPTGRLSGITAHFVPSYLQKNRMPSWETNCIEDWEEKVVSIVEETYQSDMTLISGIPPWVQMYFEKLMQKTRKKNMSDVFPNFNLFVTGGVAFEPYSARFQELFGKKIPILQTYPASEGFFAYQDQLDSSELLLLLDNGIFYEFIPTENYFDEHPPRLTIKDVELGVNYALIISTNAGLWAYSIGDTVMFVSLNPFRIKVSGRIKHFISAFGEHVIGSEVENSMEKTILNFGGRVREFTVAPEINPPGGGLPYHEWFVAFDELPEDIVSFSKDLDSNLRKKNSYYDDLIQGGVLRPCVVRPLPAEAFIKYMKAEGKLGAQNKVPRLMNDRKIADALAAANPLSN